MRGVAHKLGEKTAPGRRGCGVCAKGWRRWWHSIASSRRPRDWVGGRRRGAYGGARGGLFAWLAAVSRAGAALAGIAFAPDADREALASLASGLAWAPFVTGASAQVVFHRHDPSFGVRPRG